MRLSANCMGAHRGGPVALALALCGMACLTPGQSRSVGDQVKEIRRQAEEVRSQQERNREELDALPPLLEEGTGVDPIPGSTAPGGGPFITQAHEQESPAPLATDPATGDGGPDEVPVLLPLELPPAASPEPRAPETTVGDPGPQGDAAALYREGYALYHRRDYVGSERKLREFLSFEPRGPLADNATYWVGECYFARGLYHEALGEFRTVVERFPEGNKAPHAQFKVALCHEKLGEETLMKRALTAVLENFPQSDVAPLARARLEGS